MELVLKSVCSFGDSIMKGIIIDKETPQPDKFKYKISEDGFVNKCRDRLGINVFNYACYGATVTQGAKYVNRHLDEIGKSDFVLFEYGGNDCDFKWSEIAENPNKTHLPNTPLDGFCKLYSELISKVKSMNVQPVLLSLPVIDSERYFQAISRGINGDNILKWLNGNVNNIFMWHETYNIQVFKLARQLNVPIIDISSPFLNRKNHRDLLCDDGIHPNENGHQLIADTIYSFYQRMTEK